MSYSVPLPLDEGFLRRECPHCERQFKWHHGPTDERPEDAADPEVYWCPYCGETAPPDHWWTSEQLEFAQASIAGPAIRDIADEFNSSLGGQRNSFIKMSMSYDEPEPPSALHEAPDMVIVLSPCHPWEPIKIAEDWSGPVYCLVCGSAFAIG